MVFSSYCIANIISPQLFRASEAPHYTTGCNGILGCEVGAIACLGLYAVGCHIENSKRDANKGATPVAELSADELLDDLTDKEKSDFRYVY